MQTEYRGRIDSALINDIFRQLYQDLNETEKEFYGSLRTELPSRVSLVDWFEDTSDVEIVIHRQNPDVTVINVGSKYKMVVRPDREGNVVCNWEKKPIIITTSEMLEKFARWMNDMIKVILSSNLVVKAAEGVFKWITPWLQHYGIIKRVDDIKNWVHVVVIKESEKVIYKYII